MSTGAVDVNTSYRSGFSAEDFIALAHRVWPGSHDLPAIREALTRTTNIARGRAARSSAAPAFLTDALLFATVPEILVDPITSGEESGAS